MESVTIPLVNATARRAGEKTIAVRKFVAKIVITMEFAKMANVHVMTASKGNSAKNQSARIAATIVVYVTKENVIV